MEKRCKDAIFIALGLAGSVCLIYGLFQSQPKFYYVVGSILLLFTALHYQLVFFIALELIMSAGHGAVLLGIGRVSLVALPILLCFQLLFYLILSKQLQSIFQIIGIAGIALLSIGFSYENQWIFFSGSLGIALYAFYQVEKKIKICWLWAVLNTIFATIALMKII